MASTASRIQQALLTVSLVRQRHAERAELALASADLKSFQGLRFRATYADLLLDTRYKAAAGFFLSELYGDKDYAERDQQFGRIAQTISTLFPQAVADTAAALAEVHAMTEELDDLMAEQWLSRKRPENLDEACAVYIDCWRSVGDRPARLRQLEVVMRLGEELNRLTRKPGLRLLLKMMRGPAAAAGLASLQGFLESGFDAFAGMQGADVFLNVIRQRESALIEAFFEGDSVACETRLKLLMAPNQPV